MLQRTLVLRIRSEVRLTSRYPDEQEGWRRGKGVCPGVTLERPIVVPSRSKPWSHSGQMLIGNILFQ